VDLECPAFTLKPRAEEQGELANAILFGYPTMDRLVAEFGDSSARTARSSSVPL